MSKSVIILGEWLTMLLREWQRDIHLHEPFDGLRYQNL